ncbi:hypothetical protein L1987_54454 [Smallanthus sonchifolius]|uniref:Uncharacterized protein n=1 Tax=Smallanthus sonchifolius TaxID=185202 RepID=A0ACB9E769_9ASTR|nr:hypothetical protein L1987_54454 [Smallanthus sonchifolius]
MFDEMVVKKEYRVLQCILHSIHGPYSFSFSEKSFRQKEITLQYSPEIESMVVCSGSKPLTHVDLQQTLSPRSELSEAFDSVPKKKQTRLTQQIQREWKLIVAQPDLICRATDLAIIGGDRTMKPVSTQFEERERNVFFVCLEIDHTIGGVSDDDTMTEDGVEVAEA